MKYKGSSYIRFSNVCYIIMTPMSSSIIFICEYLRIQKHTVHYVMLIGNLCHLSKYSYIDHGSVKHTDDQIQKSTP